MNLESLQEMWRKDSVIDTDLYCEESTKIPQLHMRYMEFFNTYSLMKKESMRYATQQGYPNFSVTIEVLRTVMGILLISGYHCLPSRNYYWSLKSDLAVDLVKVVVFPVHVAA